MDADQLQGVREWVVQLVESCTDAGLLDLVGKLLIECGVVVEAAAECCGGHITTL